MASKSTAGAPARPAQESLPAAPESRLGTGHGELESSVITSTQFRPATSSPEEVVSVWYDSRERLASRGILPRRVPCCQEPQPFPGPFVPDPRG